LRILKEGGGFMTLNFRKSLALILIWVLCAAFLCGCGSEVAENSGETLWVVTEQSTSDGMNLQAQIIAERLEQAHPGLTIEMEILPLDRQEREVRIKRLRTQIMSGKGPDVYLLPTGGETATDYEFRLHFRARMYTAVEPLFSDVACAMRNGIFADIQPYYQADEELNTEDLKQEIMDAGVVKGSRYVLPLRFTMPVILTAPEDWSSCGLSAELLGSDLRHLVQWALSQDAPRIAAGLQLPEDASLLPMPDYDQGDIRVSQEEIAHYMRSYQGWGTTARRTILEMLDDWEERWAAYIWDTNWSWKRPISNLTWNTASDMVMSFHTIDEFNSVRHYIYKGTYWRTEGMALYVTNLADSLESLGIAKREGVCLKMFPLLTMDGSISASVSYFGAVGRNCKKPELAYEFLRQFLEEEFQWDQYRPRVKKSGFCTSLYFPRDSQALGQVEDSWPVRTKAATPYMWGTVQYQMKGLCSSFREGESRITSLAIQDIQLTDEDVPALSWPIDEVRFPVTLPEEESFEHALSLLNEEDGTTTDVDIDALAQKVYQSLWFHLMEG